MAKTFTVPQFIDVESKIIGALTVRQFLISLSGIILIFICYKLFSFLVFAVCAVIIVAIFGAFAFAKVNSRPFHFFALNFIQTSKKPELRIWNHRNNIKDEEDAKIDETSKSKEEIPQKPSLNSSRLSELSLVVDTKGFYKGNNSK